MFHLCSPHIRNREVPQVSCHHLSLFHTLPLHTHTHTHTQTLRRNQNYHDILKGMGTLKQKRLAQFDLTNQFSHLFFLGDLNYRIDQLGATEIVEYAKKFDHFSIYQEDQLKKEVDKKKVFVGYGEDGVM